MWLAFDCKLCACGHLCLLDGAGNRQTFCSETDTIACLLSLEFLVCFFGEKKMLLFLSSLSLIFFLVVFFPHLFGDSILLRFRRMWCMLHVAKRSFMRNNTKTEVIDPSGALTGILYIWNCIIFTCWCIRMVFCCALSYPYYSSVDVGRKQCVKLNIFFFQRSDLLRQTVFSQKLLQLSPNVNLQHYKNKKEWITQFFM